MNYGIIGYSGRMGKEIEKLFSANGYTLVYKKDEDNEITDSIPELLIDCSNSTALDKNLHIARGFSCPIIIGATGFSEADFHVLQDFVKTIPIVYSRNFSLGILLMKKMMKTIESVEIDWDVEILEKHHKNKKDKPSGTAFMLAETLKNEPPISSMRMGNIAGEHTVCFVGEGETLEIKHTALSRETFAKGVLESAKRIMSMKPGLYSFGNIMGLESERMDVHEWIATK